MYDRIRGNFPIKITVYTPYLLASPIHHLTLILSLNSDSFPPLCPVVCSVECRILGLVAH